jgi:quercetin 2,3-dioxygenase
MDKIRKTMQVIRSKPTLEGAGVHLRRVFGFREPRYFDPFLLLDDFRSEIPAEYLKGFPWHPHRGIETITYILEGAVEHGDSLGNSGVIRPGDIQWMTAGSGIIHQEMPKGDSIGHMGGFQLWANLPASHKMMDPRYQGVESAQIPQVVQVGGARIRVICGEVDGIRGPVCDIITEPEYFDVSIPAGAEFRHPTRGDHTVLAYVIEGRVLFGGEDQSAIVNGELAIFDTGEQMVACAIDAPARFLLLSGKPIGEPVAWYGPIVMNTQKELEIAFEEYRNGTFIKYKNANGR